MGYQLFLGDCLEVMRGMEDKSVDAIIVDPPYGTQTPEGFGYGRRQLYGGIGRTIEGDGDLSLLESVAPLMWKVAKENTWHGAFCAARKMREVLNIVCSAGFSYFGEIIWDKRQAGLGYSIRYQHESVLIFQKGEPVKSDNAIFSVISCHTVKREIKSHPHAKPVPTMKRLVEWLSPYGATVLDFTCGTGSTGVACMQTGRNFIGIEKEPKYYAIAERRIAQAQPPLFTDAGTTPANNPMQATFLRSASESA